VAGGREIALVLHPRRADAVVSLGGDGTMLGMLA
jgi:hypothetical protein